MSERPQQCKAPNSVRFATEAMAKRNIDRKNASGDFEKLWKRWKCYDHWHVRPKGRH